MNSIHIHRKECEEYLTCRQSPNTFTARDTCIMAYIHELAEWPEFTWDCQALARDLAAVRHKQGKHLGKMEALGFELRTEASLTALTNEVVKSSAIEGDHLDTDEVRSSIARKLGLDVAGLPKPGREVEGIVEMMLDATQNFDQPLTAERFHGWHAALFPTGRSGMHRITVGAWRGDDSGPMQVVSGPMGKERVHFQAPDAERLDGEMERFLEWFNRPSDIDPVLKAAVAHLWFVTIHPFDDGNGRIARAIADMALSRADGSKDRFYSMSSGIEAERKNTTSSSNPPSVDRSTSRPGWRGSSAVSTAPSMRPTRCSLRCSTRRGSGSGSTPSPSTSGSARSSTGCSSTTGRDI